MARYQENSQIKELAYFLPPPPENEKNPSKICSKIQRNSTQADRRCRAEARTPPRLARRSRRRAVAYLDVDARCGSDWGSMVHYKLTSNQLEYARAAEATWSSNARFGTGGARTSAGSGAFETALEQRLESELEPNVCCRASSVRSVVWDKRGFPLTNKLVVCSTCQLPKAEVEVNQERHNLVLARLQMLHALPYRLLPKFVNVQSEGE